MTGDGVDRAPSGAYRVGAAPADPGTADPGTADPPAGARAEDQPDGAWELSADALRRLRLGEGRPEDAFLSPPPETPVVAAVAEYSRTRGGATAFGLRGRIVATLLLLLSVWLVTRLPFGQILLWMVVPIVLVVGLRGIWHAERQPIAIVPDRPAGRIPGRPRPRIARPEPPQ